jgi:4-aminobutyrate--pyruvate transaminase
MSSLSLPNSQGARDVRYHLHAQTNPASHEKEGTFVITGGDGPYVTDDQGNRYLDAMAGLWCASLGFSNKRVVAAASAAYAEMGYCHTFGGRSTPATIDAAEAIARHVPIGDARIFFATSGSEAIETMVKLAWLYHAAYGKPERRKIIARQRAFHGSTIVAASLSGLPHMHREFGLPLPGFLHTTCPDMYRGMREGEREEDFASRLAQELEDLILAEGAHTIAAFIAEPINAGGGVIVPPRGYFPKVQEVLRRHGILCLDDEIVCGFGRTGSWFGCESVGMEPDMMAMAKGLSSSYFPISAVAVAPHIYEAIHRINADGGNFGHGFTNSGHPVGAAIVREVIRTYEEMDLIGHVGGLSRRLRDRLETPARQSRMVGDFRGAGLLFGIELVADRDRKAAFAKELAIPAKLQRLAMDRGLMLRPQGDTITFCPPFILNEREVDFIAATFLSALAELEELCIRNHWLSN